MCRTPLELLLTGAQPALQRISSADAPAAVGREAVESSSASRTTSALERQLLKELEAAAVASLHCPTCNGWLSDPVTLPCGHSLCRVHTLCSSAVEANDTSAGGENAVAECPVCRQAEGVAVRDFLLGQCVQVFCGGSVAAAERLTAKPLPPPRSRESKASLGMNNGEGCPPPKKRSRAVSCCKRSQPELPSGFANDSRGQLSCSICFEHFPEPRRVPVLLECGHALCNECAFRVQRGSKRCPLCKATMNKPLRPSRQLRIAMRFINATMELANIDQLARFEDLQEIHAAVLRYRSKAAEDLVLPLHQALHEGNVERVAELLQRRINCNQLVNGSSALHIAVSSRRFNLVQQLLDSGANPALPNHSSAETPLLLACGADSGRTNSDPARLQAVRAMLRILPPEAGRIAVSTASVAGATPLHRVAQRLAETAQILFSNVSFQEELNLARQLVEMGANIQAPNIFGQSPAQVVLAVKHADLRELFGLPPVESLLP
mmetsp:Transcript_87354/g.168081  ORF Transcript_87354/g.168081 Transcript_87354/m.168081 type:complete len:493 (-) Transcript_87354:282-1760(-)